MGDDEKEVHAREKKNKKRVTLWSCEKQRVNRKILVLSWCLDDARKNMIPFKMIHIP